MQTDDSMDVTQSDSLARQSPFEAPDSVPDQVRRKSPLFTISLIALIAVGLLVIAYLMVARTLTISTNASHTSVEDHSIFGINLGGRLLLLPGNHKITVSAPGYHAQEVSVLLGSEKNLHRDIQLQPLPGNLVIQSPVAAQIYLDDQLIGQSNSTLENIAAGTYQLRVQAPRYKVFQQTIDIEGKRTTQTLNIELQPDWVTAQLRSNPAGAQVFLDNQPVSTTPAQLQLTSGIHQLRVSKAGFQDWHKTLNVIADQPLQLEEVSLKKALAQMQLSSTPSGAQITLDGIFLGQTPLTASVVPGKPQEIIAIKEGYRTATKNLRTADHSEGAVHIALSPIMGRINLNVVPANATVVVSGNNHSAVSQSNDSSRYSLQLPARPHTVVIRHQGFETQTLKLIPRADHAQHLNVKLLTNEQALWQRTPDEIASVTGQKLTLFKPNDVFMMGASRREQGRRANEAQHQVRLDQPFYLSPTPVTNRDFRRFVRFHSSGNVRGQSLNGEQQPVVNISWQQAAQYCNWLSEEEGLDPVYQFKEDALISSDLKATGYRLPTEAEWAWAARFQQGAMLTYPWKQKTLTPPNNSANYGDQKALAYVGGALPRYLDEYLTTSPVASFSANDKGLFDLYGNVSEWIHDYYGIKAGLSLKAARNPGGPASGDNHVIRGSSWKSKSLSELRLAWRDAGSAKQNNVGFRIARTINPKP